MSKEAPFASVAVSEKVKTSLVDFFRSLGRDIDEITDDTDLIRGTGASSDEGVEFAIDLSDVLGVEVPNNFNPFVHSSGQRANNFRELVQHAERFVATSKENGHGV